MGGGEHLKGDTLSDDNHAAFNTLSSLVSFTILLSNLKWGHVSGGKHLRGKTMSDDGQAMHSAI